MNLLMITGDRSLVSGKRGAFYNTLEELRHHFGRIDIICPRPRVRYLSSGLQPFPNVHLYPSPWPLVFQWFWIRHRGLQLIATYKPAIMTVHEYAPVFNGVGARLLRRATGIPFVLEVMHIPGLPRSADVRERINRWLTRCFIASEASSAAAVRVINKHQTPDFLIAAGVPRDKILYSPAFYIDVNVFKPAAIQSKGRYDIIFVGRMSRNKGLDIFLDVMELTGLVGIAVGDGPLLDWARQQARKRKLKIHFPGFAKDSVEVARYLNASKVLLMPSLNEGGPRVVLEALACGVPVVATPVGIVPDILPAECIAEWNPADIAAKVKIILGDITRYSRLREQGIATSRQFERTISIKNYADQIKGSL